MRMEDTTREGRRTKRRGGWRGRDEGISRMGRCSTKGLLDCFHALRYVRPDNHWDNLLGTVWARLSWRKHVAYRLWRDGLLSSPYEAEMWATGKQEHRQ